MNSLFSNFSKLAQFLKHPLVLMGFVIMLIFSVHDKIIEKGIIPTLSQDQGNIVVQLILAYGFWLGMLVVVLGFAWQFYKIYAQKKIETSTQAAEISLNINQTVTTLIKQHQLESQAKDEQINKALTVAVTALRTGHGIDASPSETNEAFAALKQGNTTLAKNLFTRATQKREQQAQQTAQAYRNLGALAFLDNTQEALQAYRRATLLDPDKADGWNQLGHLLMRVSDLNEAITAYNTVITLGKQHGDNQEIAWGYLWELLKQPVIPSY